MNIKSTTVAVTDKLKCETCSHILVCKMYEKLSTRSITTIIDDDESDAILTSMCCKYHSNPFALHLKSTPEDFVTVKKLLNEGTGIEYLQNQPECAVKKDDQATCSTNETHDDCHGCRAEKKAMYEEPCSSCYDHALFVKRS